MFRLSRRQRNGFKFIAGMGLVIIRAHFLFQFVTALTGARGCRMFGDHDKELLSSSDKHCYLSEFSGNGAKITCLSLSAG